MPRSRRRRPERSASDDSFRRLVAGWRRTESRRGVEWIVQPVPADRSEKTYVCPGCGRGIPPGEAHLVIWRADGVLGDAADLAARRHWHTHCWRMY
ncbi:hypothetical protein [Microbacterium sp. SORGH_AS_0888]|uniref:hypothetical protein n=1 Tax=Microbacterium sp. SORGH_AS_0888 TaxID=3041791 RepID=UPI00277E2D04|nr:hypothetical protein [Microbacterium sp. SORGH_AS_0888]MDQ1128783.1 hypothetical protein [Microbacterium sp. SORGH_AS_0888]